VLRSQSQVGQTTLSAMQNLLLVVLALPLFSFLTIASSGRYIGVYGSMFLSVVNICAAFVISIALFFLVSFESGLYVEL
jgi:hypothetical protein